MYCTAARSVDFAHVFEELRACCGIIRLKQPSDRSTNAEPGFAWHPEQRIQRDHRINERVGGGRALRRGEQETVDSHVHVVKMQPRQVSRRIDTRCLLGERKVPSGGLAGDREVSHPGVATNGNRNDKPVIVVRTQSGASAGTACVDPSSSASLRWESRCFAASTAGSSASHLVSRSRSSCTWVRTVAVIITSGLPVMANSGRWDAPCCEACQERSAAGPDRGGDGHRARRQGK